MIIQYRDIKPKLHPSTFVDQSAMVIGDVEIGEDSSIWFMSIVRGDVNYIRIGENTNIQDQCMIHVTKDKFPTHIGSNITIGHRVTMHGCTIRDNCLIGMGAIILDDAEIGENSIIGAGSIVTPGTKIPPGSVAMGSPAKVVREVRPSDADIFEPPLKQYTRLALDYQDRNSNK